MKSLLTYINEEMGVTSTGTADGKSFSIVMDTDIQKEVSKIIGNDATEADLTEINDQLKKDNSDLPVEFTKAAKKAETGFVTVETTFEKGEQLLNALLNKYVVNFVYKKKDGSMRPARGTLVEDIILQQYGDYDHSKDASRGGKILTYWDINCICEKKKSERFEKPGDWRAMQIGQLVAIYSVEKPEKVEVNK